MRDILTLNDHPGWTYADLQNTPDRIVEGIRLLDQKKAQANRGS